MALEKFDLRQLAAIDEGKIAEDFEDALREVERDCRSRPMLDKDRTVAIVLKMRPVADADGKLLEVKTTFDVKSGKPVTSSKVYHMAAGRGGLFYNELSPDDAKQLTLDEVPRTVGDASKGRGKKAKGGESERIDRADVGS